MDDILTATQRMHILMHNAGQRKLSEFLKWYGKSGRCLSSGTHITQGFNLPHSLCAILTYAVQKCNCIQALNTIHNELNQSISRRKPEISLTKAFL